MTLGRPNAAQFQGFQNLKEMELANLPAEIRSGSFVTSRDRHFSVYNNSVHHCPYQALAQPIFNLAAIHGITRPLCSFISLYYFNPLHLFQAEHKSGRLHCISGIYSLWLRCCLLTWKRLTWALHSDMFYRYRHWQIAFRALNSVLLES